MASSHYLMALRKRLGVRWIWCPHWPLVDSASAPVCISGNVNAWHRVERTDSSCQRTYRRIGGRSEVLASRTVRDLSAGSGLTFESLGPRHLKGPTGRGRYLPVTTPTSGLTPWPYDVASAHNSPSQSAMRRDDAAMTATTTGRPRPYNPLTRSFTVGRAGLEPATNGL